MNAQMKPVTAASIIRKQTYGVAVKNGNTAYAKSVLGLYEKNGKDITCDGDSLENDVARLKTVAES